MNYIIHLNTAFQKFCEDERLSPFHVSLYFALFQYWNLAKFRTPISISRSETMRAAKIGSVNTYIRCMKELDKWAYIQYQPSFNPLKGSQVHMYNFDKTIDNAPDMANDKNTGKAAKKATGKTEEKVLIPSINSTNIKNKTNKLKQYGKHKKNSTSDEIKKGTKHSAGEEKKNSAKKVEASVRNPERQPREKTSVEIEKPSLREVKLHFVEKKWPLLEAEKFFNHYESNGWLVGGKAPMRNWKAASKNWMLNSEKFAAGKTKPAAGKLHTSENKDYAEPL